MKIESGTPTGLGMSISSDVERVGASSARPLGGTSSSASAPKGDTVVISALSTQLQAMSSGAANETVNTARIEEIKLAISEGRLSVNAEAVADKLLQTVTELIGTQRRA